MKAAWFPVLPFWGCNPPEHSPTTLNISEKAVSFRSLFSGTALAFLSGYKMIIGWVTVIIFLFPPSFISFRKCFEVWFCFAVCLGFLFCFFFFFPCFHQPYYRMLICFRPPPLMLFLQQNIFQIVDKCFILLHCDLSSKKLNMLEEFYHRC